MEKSIKITQDFFHQYIRCYLMNEPSPSVPHGIDMSLLIKYVHEHRLDFLFTKVIHHASPYHHQQHVHKFLSQTRRLLDIAVMFEQQSIDYVILKGIPLSHHLYGQQCMRISKDIDVLVKLSDLLVTHDILISLGYTLLSPVTPSMITNGHSLLAHAFKDLVYKHQQHRVEVELHWKTAMTSQVGFELQNIERLKEGVCVQHQMIPTLSDEYNFVYLCTHGAISQWRRIQWLLDVAVFYKKKQLCWETVIKIAIKYGGIRAILEAQSLLQESYGFDIKHVIPCSRLARSAVRIRLYYVKWIWMKTTPLNRFINVFFRLFFYSMYYQKFDYIRKLMFLQRDFIKNPYRYR